MDDEKGSGAWSRVPTWDGDPKSWRAFKREMDWWLESLDVASTTKYNLAARWLLRQTGIVRQRGEEFSPSELAHQPEVTGRDPETGEDVVLTPADPLHGIRKLMSALESINGKTVLDKRGDLRNSFYLEMKRKPGERISEFCTRFRSAVADLRMEGVTLPSGELGWFLKQKLGLDAIRQQLLETALQGKETYEETEVEVLRLFRDLHVSDPLSRRVTEAPRNPVLNRFLAQQRGFPSTSSYPPSSAAASMSSGGSGKTSSTFASRNSTYRRPFPSSMRQANVTETEEDEAPEDEEEPTAEPEGGGNLEEVLQAEAEILATELEEALEDGVDADFIQSLEDSVESAAEALVTMREARHQLAEVKKDRGYGKVPPSGSAASSAKSKVDAKKSSGKYPCFDCGKPGHWAGDAACPNPGAGLGRKGARKPKSVKVVESFNTEHVVDVGLQEPQEVNEVLTVSKAYPNMSIGEALDHVPPGREVNAVHVGLAQDKRLVGALDSACNRTVTGPQWLNTFIQALQTAPSDVQALVQCTPENETFRFGDGGTQVSRERWRLPMMIGNNLVCFNVSIVPVPSLGLLLGRDFLETLGATISFSKRVIKFDYIDSTAIPLKQLAAGHYLLPLLPPSWRGVGTQRWRRLGIDGVVELQMSTKEWLRRKLGSQTDIESQKGSHEHFLTERSLKASLVVHDFVDEDEADNVPTLVQDLRMTRRANSVFPTSSSPASSRPSSLARRSERECLTVTHGNAGKCGVHAKVAKIRSAPRRKIPMALFWTFALACAASRTSASPLSVPFSSKHTPVGDSGLGDDGSQEFAKVGFSEGAKGRWDQSPELAECRDAAKPHGPETGLLGRPAAFRNVGWEGSCGSGFADQAGCHQGGPAKGSGGVSKGQGRGRSTVLDRSSRWTSNFASRLSEIGSLAEGERDGQDDCPRDQRGSSAQCGAFEEPAKVKGASTGRASFQGSSGSVGKGAKCHEVFSVFSSAGGPIPNSSSAKAVSRDDESSRNGIESASSRAWNPKSRSRDESVRHGGQRCDDGRSVRRWHGAVTGGLGSDQCGGLPRPYGRRMAATTGGPIWPCRPDRGGENSGVGSVNDAGPWELQQDLKRGQAKLIADAWNRHMADCKRVSQGRQEIRQVMLTEFEEEMRGYINDEPFVHAIDLSTSLSKSRSLSGSSFSSISRSQPMTRTLKGSSLLKSPLSRLRGIQGKTEQRSMATPLVSEVYTNTQRVMKEAARRGHRVGTPMSLETGWNFLNKADREEAKRVVRSEKPLFLMLAFPCGPFSPLQRLNPSPRLQELQDQGRVLMDFALELAQIQLDGGRHYVLENPKPSGAWKEPRMLKFLASRAPAIVDFDQCRLGLRSRQGNLHRKSTRLVSSSFSVASKFEDQKCTRTHLHDPVIGGVAVTARAGHYPVQLARCLVKGMEEEFNKGSLKSSEVLAVGHDEGEDDFAVSALPHFDSDSEIEEGIEQSVDEKIPASVKATVARLHENTGHRSNRRLARALTLAGAPAIVVRAAEEHKCSICLEKVPPKPQRPASLPHPRDVSDQVHCDLLEAVDSQDNKYVIIHVTDFCTRFQMAQILDRKAADDVIKFFKVMWMPVFGPMRVLVCDQGREFVSHQFQDFCSEQSVLLWHTGVGAPWQNGIAERSGGILKALLAATVSANSVIGKEEMSLALGEALSAYNNDINDSGVSPAQAALGKAPRLPGDVLTDIQGRLAEHDLVTKDNLFARQLALRETAKVAMTRLHFSRGLRRAELARNRSSTIADVPAPGDIVYFFRFQKYNNKLSGSRKRLSLRRWHGPALLVAVEKSSDGGDGANGYLSFKGQLTKCSLEHIRRASPMEQITTDTWRGAIEDAVCQAVHDMTLSGLPSDGRADPTDGIPATPAPSTPAPATPMLGAPSGGATLPAAVAQEQALSDLPPVQPQEVVGAVQASFEQGAIPSQVGSLSRRQSSEFPAGSFSRRQSAEFSAPATPLTNPLPSSSAMSQRMSTAIDRVREMSGKRASEVAPEQLRLDVQQLEAELPDPSAVQAGVSDGVHDALMMSKEEIFSVLEEDAAQVHPLVRLHAEACGDRLQPLDSVVRDHGTWRGDWQLPSQTEWSARQKLGCDWPCGQDDFNEAMAVQTARKEYFWSNMNEDQKEAYRKAADAGWNVWIAHDAVEVLPDEEAARVRSDLKKKKEECKILTPRWVFTDKHDGLRTPQNNLELKANARLVVPGFKDVISYGMRKDAPTASRTSQHLVFTLTASYHSARGWRLLSVDVKSAFMKGAPYLAGTRELFVENVKGRHGEPMLPFCAIGLAKVKKGVFGLSDAPRQWYLRLHRALTELGWIRSTMDAVCWFLWGKSDSGERILLGVVLSHVDDLLCGGCKEALDSIMSLEAQLGFGTVERDSFVYCGKKVSQDEHGVVHVTMPEYHANLQPVSILPHRKRQPDAELTDGERRQLRAILGSLQWLVAQVRVDQGFALSTLQGEKPTIGTLLRANILVKNFKSTASFGLRFYPMSLKNCGIMVVSDASLGNVTKDGGTTGDVSTKVCSQASYVVLLAEEKLMKGETGRCCLLDARSHRLQRVCRSTFAAELLGTEEAFDVGQYCRGLLASISGYPLEMRHVDTILDAIPLTVVVDAKDVFDKCLSDTPSYGSQKSLAFTVAWIRTMLRRPNTSLRWTSTENMFVDGGTKEMDLEHMREILTSGEWCPKYTTKFIKQSSKGGKTKPLTLTSSTAELPGQLLSESHAIFPYLHRLGETPGWHFEDRLVMQVARNAKSFRSPAPRCDPQQFPLRSTYGRFDHDSGFSEWRVLEEQVPMKELRNLQAPLGAVASVLCTIYRPMSTKEEDQLLKHGIDMGNITDSS